MTALQDIVDLDKHPLSDSAFCSQCRGVLARDGALVMRKFLKPDAIEAVRREGSDNQHLTFYSTQRHNVYLTPPDPDFSDHHPRNRLVTSTKGCITDDIVPANSALRTLYNSSVFKEFLCAVLGEEALYEYADTLSSVNIHYAKPGQELGWHFDNSSFALTLMLEEPERGGAFEYVQAVRDADRGEMNYDTVGRVLDGDVTPRKLAMDAGALVLFRGRNAMHRVAPVEGSKTRMLVVLAYNSKPGISLSESARMTFYGRLN